ncbi:hypothetical protein SSX86_015630 [Deinandra increscens subsp. villosa]|uniref:Uncharacterized protein n=1 Tax=Deinandra increscens subsp. villosa TaxID=3103831 RepID=A0AAP0D162_9ASTR
MGGATTRIPMSHRILSPSYNYSDGDNYNSGDQPVVQLSGSIFGFLEEDTAVLSSPETDRFPEIEDGDENEKTEKVEDKIKFWETQHQNLNSTLFRTTSLESRIRTTTKELVAELETGENVCSCSRNISGDCRNCRMREICRRLQVSGYNSAICKSKWKSSSDIPSGEHTYIDVIDNSNRKKPDTRIIIELEFRGQFEMKKGSDEYNGLVSKLPEVFVGKIERLQAVIKILSTAAKRCMKEKKMHLGPWRKQPYMEAKWVRVVERTTSVCVVEPLATVDRDPTHVVRTRARSSMLTMDLLDNVPNMSSYFVPLVEVLSTPQFLTGHPWIMDDKVAPPRLFDFALISHLEHFSAMNKLRLMAYLYIYISMASSTQAMLNAECRMPLVFAAISSTTMCMFRSKRFFISFYIYLKTQHKTYD